MGRLACDRKHAQPNTSKLWIASGRCHLASNKGRFRVVEEQNGNLPDLMCTSGFCICADPAVDACAGHFGAMLPNDAMLPNSIRAKLIITCLNCNLAQFQALMIGLGLRQLCREVDHSECTGKFCLHDLPEGQFSSGACVWKILPSAPRWVLLDGPAY